MRIFEAGLIGCGRIGSEFDDHQTDMIARSHAGAYSTMQNMRLIAACDLDRNKLQKCGKRWGIPHLYIDYREMLAKEKFDILSICTPNSTHLGIVKEAARRDVKAIFCEKPIAETLRDADEMINLCNQEHILLQINHYRRFDGLHREIRTGLKNNCLGNIQQVSFYYVGGIANTGSHMFDLLRFFFGEVNWIQAVYSENRSPNPEDPNVDGMLKFANGILCMIQACDSQYFPMFELNCLGSQACLKLKHSGKDIDFWTVHEDEINQLYQATAPIKRKSPFGSMTHGVKHLVNCLETNEVSLSSGKDGRSALELICASLESANSNGNRIKLPLMGSDIRVRSR